MNLDFFPLIKRQSIIERTLGHLAMKHRRLNWEVSRISRRLVCWPWFFCDCLFSLKSIYYLKSKDESDHLHLFRGKRVSGVLGQMQQHFQEVKLFWEMGKFTALNLP